MKYTYEDLLERADKACVRLRMRQNPYKAPELLGKIESNQVKAMIQIFAEVVNEIQGDKVGS